MHKPNDVNIVYIPHDFKVACRLFNLSIQKFLQFFIDHISIYDAFFDTEVDAYELATRALSKYSFEKDNLITEQKLSNSSVSSKNLEKSVQAILGMRSIALGGDLNNKQKREMAAEDIQKLFINLCTGSINPKILHLNEHEDLKLSPDFRLICEITQISPIEYLTNIMEHISIADMEARSSLNMRIENPALTFYLVVRDGYGNLYDNRLLHPLMIDYLDDLQELKLELFIYRSLVCRVRKHRDLLNKYYNLIP